MPLIPTSSDMSLAQLCSAINDWTSLPFDRKQYHSLQAQLGEQTAWLSDDQFEHHRPEITLAFNQLKRWSSDYVYHLAKTLEACYA